MFQSKSEQSNAPLYTMNRNAIIEKMNSMTKHVRTLDNLSIADMKSSKDDAFSREISNSSSLFAYCKFGKFNLYGVSSSQENYTE